MSSSVLGVALHCHIFATMMSSALSAKALSAKALTNVLVRQRGSLELRDGALLVAFHAPGSKGTRVMSTLL